jgi:hypothetical protein
MEDKMKIEDAEKIREKVINAYVTSVKALNLEDLLSEAERHLETYRKRDPEFFKDVTLEQILEEDIAMEISEMDPIGDEHEFGPDR